MGNFHWGTEKIFIRSMKSLESGRLSIKAARTAQWWQTWLKTAMIDLRQHLSQSMEDTELMADMKLRGGENAPWISLLWRFSSLRGFGGKVCRRPRIFSSDGVCQGSPWLLLLPLCWRRWSLDPCVHLHYSWWWEVQTSRISQLGRFPTRRDLSAFRGQTCVFLACWFFSNESVRSLSASRGHF